jgi:hypothetical protein
MTEEQGKNREEIAAQLGEAFLRREKLANELNKETALCAKLANELEATKPEE